jgi:septum formation protein
MLSNLNKYKIVLCSNSPRRKELLKGLGIDFQVRVVDGIDETYDNTLSGDIIAQMISTKKIDVYSATMKSDELLITADTIVYSDNEVLGKPFDRTDAIRMLQKLSGKSHDVITGVSVQTIDNRITFSVITKVTFANISDDEIIYYVDKFKPYDKAGSYGIQEWIGYIGVKMIEGSFFNVMGLPIQKLYSILKTL